MTKIGRALAAVLSAAVVVTIGAALLRHAPGRSAGPSAAAQAQSRQRPARCGVKPAPLPARFVGVAVNAPLAASAAAFSQVSRVRPSVLEYYSPFGGGFSPALACSAVTAGSMPLIQINPRHASVASIADGRWDQYLKRYALSIRRFGESVVLSFGHEMNGSWYSWGEPRTTPAQFIAAWRHIYRIFAGEHVTNVTWSWDVDHAGSPPRTWWPGAAYVDWVGVDGYLRPGQTFDGIFARTLTAIRKLTGKPIVVTETGVAPDPQRPAQIRSIFAGASAWHLSGVVWFDIDAHEQWRINADKPALAAFRSQALAYGADQPSR